MPETLDFFTCFPRSKDGFETWHSNPKEMDFTRKY